MAKGPARSSHIGRAHPRVNIQDDLGIAKAYPPRAPLHIQGYVRRLPASPDTFSSASTLPLLPGIAA